MTGSYVHTVEALRRTSRGSEDRELGSGARLGRLLAARFLTGGRGEDDREAAIAVLTDVIVAEETRTEDRAAAHFALAQVLLATLLPSDLLRLCHRTAVAAPDVTLLGVAVALSQAATFPGRGERAAATLAHLRAAADSGRLTDHLRRTAEAELTLVTLLLQESPGPGDNAVVATTVDRLRGLSTEPSLAATGSGRLRHVAGLGGLFLYELSGDRELLDRAIADLEDTGTTQPPGAGLASTGRLKRILHRAYRCRVQLGTATAEDLQAATDSGLAALAEEVRLVFLRHGPVDGLPAALAVSDFAHDLALHTLTVEHPEAALAALELGRGLVTYAATDTTSLPDLLEAEGFQELSAEWRALDGEQAETPLVPAEAAVLLEAIGPDITVTPTSLRLRTLEALTDTTVGQALFFPCDADTVADALRSSGRDALVHLLCGDADRSGWALMVTATGAVRSVELPALRTGRCGPLEAFLATAIAGGRRPADPVAFDELCRWVGMCVLEPVLARLPVGDPRLTLVPWGPLNTVPWAAGVVHAETGSGVRACEAATWSYAASARQFVERARSRSTTPVRPLPGRGLAPDVRWAEPEVDPAGAWWNPAPASHGGSDTDVITALWPVPDQSGLLMHKFRERLDSDEPPDVALRSVQRWMLDPHRVLPDGLPAGLAEIARSTDLADPLIWAAFTCDG